MKVLVLGVTGMLGHAVFKLFSADDRYDTWGTLRGASGLGYFSDHLKSRLLPGIDVLDQDVLADVLAKVRPDVVINCVGLIKQLSSANDPLSALPINAMLPHRLAKLCALLGARLVHISTDCVFSGSKGSYTERDVSDANDLYGRSKFIGELHDLPHAITLRTSIIGHELGSCYALVDWFLSQSESVKGYAKAIFSGLPTVELARVIKDYVLPNPSLHGLYHVSAEPIDKFSLLRLVADIYGKKIKIHEDHSFSIDRSLDSSAFRLAAGYVPPAWPDLISLMHSSR
ncbi:dTDP-4-dehydrorhamnose reductase family protein [Ectopseudomonas guguanensis]|jgi:dTDP-4-dehydrorhamnose reductase|uniref:dTDP-4-dehydrorhamnose reductase family protein n=1 Tax=Ectopseudomonas guguanensis TaxID=1198456 RepID=UPI0039C0F7FD